VSEIGVCGTLAEPASAPGRRLLDLLAPHLPTIAEAAPRSDENGNFPAEIFARLRAAGATSATAPAEFGGLGVGSLHDVCLALMQTARADASTALCLHMQLSRGISLTHEWRHGSPAGRSLAERMLRLIGSGEAIVCGAVAEQGRPHGSPGAVLEKDEAGGWKLSGRKSFVTLAPAATHFAVNAMICGQDRAAMAMVPRSAPGVVVHDTWNGLGMRASGSVDVSFDGCRVPDSSVVPRGAPGDPPDAGFIGQTVSSVCMLGIYLGVATAARDIAVPVTARRDQASASAARTLVAEVEARLFAVRAAIATAIAEIQRLSDLLAAGRGQDRVGQQMMTRFQCAKILTNRFCCAVVDDCLTLAGGEAYTIGHPLTRIYRDVRAGGFMQPYSYVRAVDFLSSQAFAGECGVF